MSEHDLQDYRMDTILKDYDRKKNSGIPSILNSCSRKGKVKLV